eukprot:NODE_301_length_11418_cov_0.342521.p8 type:complete len:195 gc:universal NODE_301_length_11418_cov_0.342521:3284-3868(+)
MGTLAGTFIVPIFVGVSMFITCVCNIFVFARTFEAIARENLFPFKEILQRRNRYNMPYNAAIVVSIVAISYTLGMPNENGLNFLIDAASYPHWISTAVVIATLIYIRVKHVEVISPYTSWLSALVIFLIGTIFIVLFPMISNTNPEGMYDSRLPILMMAGVMLLGLVLFSIIRKTILVHAFQIQQQVVKVNKIV